MTITVDSRYIDADLVYVETSRGVVPTIYTPTVVTSSSYILYQSVEGDTFEILAHRVYGDVRMWWKVADMNPHVYFPGVITPGTTLRIPA